MNPLWPISKRLDALHDFEGLTALVMRFDLIFEICQRTVDSLLFEAEFAHQVVFGALKIRTEQLSCD